MPGKFLVLGWEVAYDLIALYLQKTEGMDFDPKTMCLASEMQNKLPPGLYCSCAYYYDTKQMDYEYFISVIAHEESDCEWDVVGTRAAALAEGGELVNNYFGITERPRFFACMQV